MGFRYEDYPLPHLLMGCTFTGILDITVMLKPLVLEQGDVAVCGTPLHPVESG